MYIQRIYISGGTDGTKSFHLTRATNWYNNITFVIEQKNVIGNERKSPVELH